MKRIFWILICLGLVGCNVNKEVKINEDLDYLKIENVEAISDRDLSSFENMLIEMDNAQTLWCSLIIDSYFIMDKESLGEFDHVVLTNQEGLKKLGNNKHLKPVALEEVSKTLQDALVSYQKVFAKETKLLEFSLYHYASDDLVALPFNLVDNKQYQTNNQSFKDKLPVTLENSLVVLVENLSEAGAVEEFLLPLVNSGNIVFSDEKLLKEIIEINNLNKIIKINDFNNIYEKR
ncbi:DUF6619 domain-containing protein [Thomasclavelia spiroformis]|uniref:DUF6619 domain-containing protein n=1 Tax=Thomasclavelia spiroformis TaxID=29348 RepID=UPI00241D45E5|nr:hypothetical protein [Thomasclavelia spiroformis]MBS6115071.1 hypothetical protein [Thomasclavelia spiroformis]